VSLGFQKIGIDPKLSVYWMYTAVEHFSSLDMEEVVSKLEFASPSPEF
jgi:hypothetical protein